MERVLHGAVQLDAAEQESPSVTVVEHGDLAVELLQLLAKDHRQGRILDALHRRAIERALEHHRLLLQGTVGERGDPLESAPPKLVPRRAAVDGRDLEQEVKRLRDVREDPIHVPDCFDNGASTEGVEMARPVGGLLLDKIEQRPPERHRDAPTQESEHLGEHLP